MPLIKKQQKPARKDTLSIRIESSLKARLDQYCEFIQSGRHHVVEESLRITFQHDKDFQEWLRVQDGRAENRAQSSPT